MRLRPKASTEPDFTVAVYDSFDGLPPTCLALFRGDTDASVFSTLPWYRNLGSAVLSRSGTLRIYVVSDQASAEPMMVMPMWHARTNALVGERALQAAANFYASLYTPLLRANCAHPDQVVQVMAAALAAERPRWERVMLFPMATESPLYGLLADALARAGYIIQRYFGFGNWYLSIGGRTYEQYLDSVPSKLRHTVARKSRQLVALGGFRIAILTEPEQATEGSQAFNKVYAASWKNAEPFPAFIPGLIDTCAKQGWLRMGVAYLNDVPIAFQIWIVHRHIASIYKLAYREEHAKLSVGSVLTASMMRYVIDVDKVVEVDYLTGDEAYKQDWMAERRERWGIAGFDPRTLRGALGASKSLVRRYVKKKKSTT
ncbi:MAG: GNAT family N-acetyltransferase [Herminiimonas sp.]|nr:GNAT family N-acetyltransferase [Herminiimonas sp.]